MTLEIAALILAWIVILALSLTVLALARQVGILHQRIAPAGALLARAGPEQGSAAPVVEVTALDGSVFEVGRQTGSAELILFVSPGCPLCKALLPILPGFADREKLAITLASDDSIEPLEAMAARFGLDRSRFVNSPELGRTWAVDKLPHAVLLDETGRVVARGLVNSREHLESMTLAHESGHGSIQSWFRSKAA